MMENLCWLKRKNQLFSEGKREKKIGGGCVIRDSYSTLPSEQVPEPAWVAQVPPPCHRIIILTPAWRRGHPWCCLCRHSASKSGSPHRWVDFTPTWSQRNHRSQKALYSNHTQHPATPRRLHGASEASMRGRRERCLEHGCRRARSVAPVVSVSLWPHRL